MGGFQGDGIPLARRDHGCDGARCMNARDRNRARFTAAAELKDLFAAQGMDGAIVYAENVAGETIGKRDPGPWIDWTLIERAKRWNDRVYGREAVQPDAAPKRRSMTDAQRARLRGDV